jgi:ParB family transcriptional regulator, chromosome partitioning protein
MADVISVSPFKCRMWRGHERLEDHVNEDTCREEIESVLAHGQLIPALARTLKNDSDHAFEVIYGSRRLFVARHLNIPIRLEVRELSDREATIALESENRLRKDFSPYERARNYAAWLRSGLFKSQDELARVLNVSRSQVSRLLKLAQLPAVIVSAFARPTDICETWGRDLIPLWEDPHGREELIVRARALAKDPRRPGAPAIFQRLIANTTQRGLPAIGPSLESHDEVVKDERGMALFRVRVHRKDVALLLPSGGLSKQALVEIKSEVAAILQRRRSSRNESPSSSADARRSYAGERREISLSSLSTTEDQPTGVRAIL